MPKTFNNDKSDGIAFDVASEMAKQEATAPALNIPLDGVDVEGFRAQLGNAAASLNEAHIPPDELDFDTAEMIGAAFRQGNIVGSTLSSESFAEGMFHTQDSPDLSDEQLIERLKKDGMLGMADNFADVYTEAQYDARKNDIAQEQHDRQLLEASGITGTAALMAAGVLDLPTLVPVGRAVQLGKLAAGAGRSAAEVGLASGISAAATEAVFQQTQQTRTAEESAMAIGSATVLGAALGFGIHAAIGNKAANKVAERLDNLRKDSTTGFAGAKSAGAAAIEFAEQLRAQGLDGDSRVFSAGAFKILEKAGKIPGFVGANLRNPRMELENGIVGSERRFIAQMTHNPSISVKQAEAGKLTAEGASIGKEAPVNVASKMAEFQGGFVEGVYQVEKLWKQNKANYKSFDDFGDQVAMALVSGDKSADPVVEQSAKIMRERIFDPIRQQHVDNGNWTDDMTPRNAESYLTLVHDADAARANRSEWTEFYEAAYLHDLEEQYRLAQVEKSARASDKADLKIRAEKASEAEIKVLTAEHDENIRALRETRGEQMAEIDARVKEDMTALKDAHDAHIDELRATRDEMVAGEHPKGQVKASRDKYRQQFKDAEGKAKVKYAKDQARIERRAQVARNRVTKKFDKQENKARAARDKSKADILAKRSAELDVGKQIKLSEGLPVLKFATRAAREAEAAKRAEAHYNAVTGNARFTSDTDIMVGAGGYAKFRRNPAHHAELIRRGYVKTNIFDIAEHYTRTAGVDAAIGSVFKKVVNVKGDTPGSRAQKLVGDITLSEPKRAIANEYKNALSSAKTPKEEIALKNMAKRSLENVDMLRRFAHGQPFADGTSQSFAQAAELVGGFNFLRLMGGTVASSLGDPLNIVMANGWGRTMRHGILPMLKNFKEAVGKMDADQLRLARLAHANTEITMNSTVMAMAELGNPYAQATPLLTFVRNASKVFSKATGITYWNHLWKQVAFNTTTARIVENARTGWAGLSGAERTFMLNLGLNEASLARIGASFEGQAGTKWVAGTDLPIARFDEWADKEAGSLLRAAANMQSHNNVVTPHWSDKMAMSGNPMGVLMLQFRNFMISNQARIIGRNIQLAAIDEAGAKRASVATAMFGLAMMGAVVDATKHILGTTTISGGSIDKSHSSFERVLREWDKTPGTALYNSLDRTGIFGVVFEASNMAEKMGLPNIRGGMSKALGDDQGAQRGSSRYSTRHWTEALGGPTVGLIGDVQSFGSLLTGYADSFISGNEAPNFNRSDFRRAKRLLPFQTAPGVQQLVNEGERFMGNQFDWPDPK